MKGLIRFAFDKIIDASSVKAWDKVVFDETYQEFFMQAQRYDQAGQYPTLAALLANVPKSDVTQKAMHRIAIRFHSDPITWIDQVGSQLLVTYGDQRAALEAGQEVPTDLIPMQPHLSISTFQPV